MSSGSTSAGLGASLVKPSDGIVSRTLNRRLSTRISLRLARLRRPPSPDLVSVIAAALVALGGPLFAAGHPVLAGLAAQLGSILDGVDGELARLTGRASRAGALLDTVLDRLADTVLLLGAGLASTASLEPTAAVALTAAGLSGDLMVSYLHAYAEKLLGRHPALTGRIPNIAGRDTRLFTVFIAGLLGSPVLALAAIAILGHGYTLAKTVELLQALDREAAAREKS